MGILVTGASGFIDRFVIKKLLGLGYDIVATASNDPGEAKNILPCFSGINNVFKALMARNGQ